MYKAKEAKALTLENLEIINKNKTPDEILTKFFDDKIRDCCQKGSFDTGACTFPQDRFKKETYEKVLSNLKSLGYNANVEVNNAYQKVTFSISWK